jgi:folate-binding protein YgfZ
MPAPVSMPTINERELSLARKARDTGFFAWIGQPRGEDGNELGVLTVTGGDAPSFLHSQLTSDVKALKPGEGQFSARVTRTGTLLRWFSLHHLPQPYPGLSPQGLSNNGYLLFVEQSGIAPLLNDLGKFAVVEDAALENVSELFDWLAIQGPQAAKLADSVFGKLNGKPWDLPENSSEFLGENIVVSRSLAGDTGFLVGIPRRDGSVEELRSQIATAVLDNDALLLEGADLTQVLNTLRIEAGVVRVGVDADENDRVLPETGLEQLVVSYTKGCYLGQEVIARIRTYGSLPWVLRGLIVDVPRADASQNATYAEQSTLLEKLPPAGSDLFLEDGKKAGEIASRTLSPVLDAPIAYAYLDKVNRTPGTVLKLKSTDGSILSARVTLLPFYKASDLKARVAFLHDRAVRLFAEGQDDAALQLLEEALRLDSAFADGYEALGVILGRKSRFEEAIEIFKRLEEVAPNEPMVHSNLSLFYMKIGDKEKAEEEKAKATVKQFSRFGAMKKDEQRASEEERKKREDALRKKQMFEEVLEIDAEDPIALFGLGNVHSTLCEWEKAENLYARAQKVQKDNSAVYLAHGKALEMLNREGDALAVYEAGLAVASKKGDLMPLKEMERKILLLKGIRKV